MNEVVATTLTVVALVVAVWAAVLMLAGKPVLVNKWHGLVALGGVALLELGLLGQAVGGIVAMIATDRELDGFSFVGYLVGPVLILPLAAFWALAERTRWGPGVLVVGCLAVPVMIVRLRQVWEAHG
ncbi:hypothetical protein [Actinophytocola xanthii]|uniref:Uncharacterized protein n=1 Tax=Actinophytocola xanthii TaxID=1912961 RepID=A0A1Q8CSZ4_9PSEU|nr:hypothetical protein [Actinophytocola xanthii]OLF17454.1 hypothetical protein BU204_10930 [Actinophytocola xanthii]